jgi:hypothetical protein
MVKGRIEVRIWLARNMKFSDDVQLPIVVVPQQFAEMAKLWSFGAYCTQVRDYNHTCPLFFPLPNFLSKWIHVPCATGVSC